MKITNLTPKFIENIPREIDDGILYVSMEFNIAIHNCCCGCQNKVVTPLSPTGWRLYFDGTITLSPSIGNWAFPCRSHYFIIDNKIKPARSWTNAEVEKKRKSDSTEIKKYYKRKNNK